jgi:hypothetical protein
MLGVRIACILSEVEAGPMLRRAIADGDVVAVSA